jgi:hypothetical protein
MAGKSSSGRAKEGAGKSAGEMERKGYFPYDRRGYTPVASAPKNPKPPQGGTGQVRLNDAPQKAES